MKGPSWRTVQKSLQKYRHHRFFPLLVSFLIGFLLGQFNSHDSHNGNYNHAAPPSPLNPQALVNHIENVPLRPTAHAGVKKHQLVEPFASHPNLAGVSVGILEPTGTRRIEMHQHVSMSEFFYVLQGQGWVHYTPDSHSVHDNDNDPKATLPPTTRAIQAGSFVFVPYGHNHSFSISETEQESLQLLFFGLTTDNN